MDPIETENDIADAIARAGLTPMQAINRYGAIVGSLVLYFVENHPGQAAAAGDALRNAVRDRAPGVYQRRRMFLDGQEVTETRFVLQAVAPEKMTVQEADVYDAQQMVADLLNTLGLPPRLLALVLSCVMARLLSQVPDRQALLYWQRHKQVVQGIRALLVAD